LASVGSWISQLLPLATPGLLARPTYLPECGSGPEVAQGF